MQAFLTSVIAMAVVLGIMIVVHEFGHFAAAKLLGVRVDVFSVGFGKRLFGWRRGETDYRLSAIPLGGYVKMAGENPMDQRTGDPAEFMAHPRWHRFIIVAAGPFMNIALAVGLLTGVFMVHYEHPVYLDQPAVIGWVLEGSPADKAGIQPGDRIVRIGKFQNPTWEDVLPEVVLSPNQPVNMAVQRGNQILDKTVVPTPVGREQFGSPGWLPDQPNTITELDSGMPAQQAGLKNGDVIAAVNGIPMKSMPAVARYIQENGEKPVEVTAFRDGKQLTFTVKPMPSEVDGEKRFRIGIRSDPQKVVKLPFTRAFAKSIEQNKRNSLLILELVQKMVRRQVSMKQVEGPIGIARASGEAARQPGWTPLLLLMAAISLNLGIFNLFPIPILDGGVILLLIVESVMGRDISQPIKERIYQAAFVFLVLFAVMVIYNDLVKTIPGLSQRLP
ncbi:MAG TPA: RIP metalloprotease RseP [Terriglobales bacterium]|nr:RIP metalloprotease RseP [Terriglobales bacterium]